MVSPFLCNFDAKYVPYIPTPTAHHAENTALYINNGVTIKLYGVRNETKDITSRGHDKMAKIIAYFIGIFFIVNHHYTKLQDMIRNFKVIL